MPGERKPNGQSGMKTLATLPAVETPQLILREVETGDIQSFSRFMLQPAYQRHIAMRLKSEAEVKAFVIRCVARQGEERRNIYHLAAEEKMSSEAIGDGFLILQRPGSIEIGWGVHPAMWAMGLGAEIGRALLGLAFERLRAERVWAKVMTSNKASLKLAAKIGLKHWQSHPDYPAGQGKLEPVEIFALTAQEYFELPY
jgi:RimJ/RimL family protein N-acetyltransferase